MSGKNFGGNTLSPSVAGTSTPPLSVVRPQIRSAAHGLSPMTPALSEGPITPALSEGPLTPGSGYSRLDLREEQFTITPGSHVRRPSRNWRDFSAASGSTSKLRTPGNGSGTIHLSELRNMMKEFTGQLGSNESQHFKLECQRLEEENAELAEALHENNQRLVHLQAQIIKIENENRIEIGSAKRQLDELQQVLEEVERAKKIAERKCDTLKYDKEHLNSYISKLPSSIDYSKLSLDLLAKTQECARLSNSLTLLKVEKEKSDAKIDILEEDLKSSLEKNEELHLSLAREKTLNEEQERRQQLASTLDPENVGALVSIKENLSIENRKLKALMIEMGKSNLKLKRQLENFGDENGRIISSQKKEIERLEIELVDEKKTNELLRNQVEQSIVDCESSRQLCLNLRKELYLSRCPQESQKDIARLERKLYLEISRCVDDLKCLLEVQIQMEKKQLPDYDMLIGSSSSDEHSDSTHLKPQDSNDRMEQLSKKLSEVSDTRQKITELRHLAWAKCASLIADNVCT